MNHLTLAYSAGKRSSANDEARSTPHAAGPKLQNTQCLNFKQTFIPAQDADGDCTVFARLSRQFESLGLRLFPLCGDSVLVSAPGLGMSRSFPDLRTARAYLREIGGAA